MRYDTRCYFNVCSKADMSQLNLPHRNMWTMVLKMPCRFLSTESYRCWSIVGALVGKCNGAHLSVTLCDSFVDR